MRHTPRTLFLVSILFLISLACTAPTLTETPSAVSTLPVFLPTQTGLPAPAASLPTDLPLPTETSAPAQPAVSTQPALTPSETATPFTFPLVTFERNTNCRVGPLKNYFLQTSFIAGRQTTAEGRNRDSSWLLVKPFEGPSCWISIANLKDPVDYSYLPVVDFPPLPEPPFQMVVVKRECGGRNQVFLRWPDVAGETSYRIYRDGIMLATLKENATEYQDYPPNANSYFYEIESVNAYGTSVRFSMSVAGCR
jgi:hypothetical protein